MRDFNRLDFFIQKTRLRAIRGHIPAGAVLLDVGCGYYPRNLLALQDQVSEAVGLDMDIPDAQPPGKIRFVKHRFDTALPFGDASFDCVLLMAVLEHLEQPLQAARECRRVLKPGGRLIVTVPSSYSEPVLVGMASAGLISREEVFDHKHYFDRPALRALLTEAGFSVAAAEYYNLFMNLLFVCENGPAARG